MGDPKSLRESCALLGRGPALRVLGQLEQKGVVWRVTHSAPDLAPRCPLQLPGPRTEVP